MLGAVIGDIVGSIYEFDNRRSRDFEFFGGGVDFTDDTVCTIAVADALLHARNPVDALHDWCTRYPHRGYGGRFRSWLVEKRREPYNSFGNGAAMRVSPAALLGATLDGALAHAHAVTAVTHNHPEGLKGAAATVHAIRLAHEGAAAQHIRDVITRTYHYDLERTVDAIRAVYVFNETCQETVPEALICALAAESFEDAIRNAISIGGDSDTVAAIAGPVAEARFGIPPDIARAGFARLPSDMQQILTELYSAAGRQFPAAGIVPPASPRPA